MQEFLLEEGQLLELLFERSQPGLQLPDLSVFVFGLEVHGTDGRDAAGGHWLVYQ